MSLFSKYRPPNYKFYEPERYANDIARERRLDAALAKNLELQARYKRLDEPLSRVAFKSSHDQIVKFLNDAETMRQKGTSNVPAKGALLTTLSRERERTARLSKEGWQKAQAAAADRRRYNPHRDRDFDPRNVYGGPAAIGNYWSAFQNPYFYQHGASLKRAVKFNAYGLPGFHMAYGVIPCIQRHKRREVMFAKKKAGRGYRVPHRRTEFSGVPC